jgi:hypothetical protein
MKGPEAYADRFRVCNIKPTECTRSNELLRHAVSFSQEFFEPIRPLGWESESDKILQSRILS